MRKPQLHHQPRAHRRRKVVAIVVAGAAIGLLAPSSASAVVNKAGGFTYVTKHDRPMAANTVKTFKTRCPDGTHVLGGGFLHSGGFLDHVLGAHSYPYDGGDRGTAFDDGWAVMLDSSDSAVLVDTYAICAPLMPAYRESPPMRFYDNNAPELNMRLCPRDTQATSGGTTGPATIFETSSYPFERWYYVQLFDSGAFGADVTVRAICIKREVAYIDGGDSTADPQEQSNDITRCPVDIPHVIGGGIATYPPDGTMMIASVQPVYYNVGVRDGWQAWVDNSAPSEGSFNVLPTCTAPL